MRHDSAPGLGRVDLEPQLLVGFVLGDAPGRPASGGDDVELIVGRRSARPPRDAVARRRPAEGVREQRQLDVVHGLANRRGTIHLHVQVHRGRQVLGARPRDLEDPERRVLGRLQDDRVAARDGG